MARPAVISPLAPMFRRDGVNIALVRLLVESSEPGGASGSCELTLE